LIRVFVICCPPQGFLTVGLKDATGGPKGSAGSASDQGEPVVSPGVCWPFGVSVGGAGVLVEGLAGGDGVRSEGVAGGGVWFGGTSGSG
jgi:hypothetical protein